MATKDTPLQNAGNMAREAGQKLRDKAHEAKGRIKQGVADLERDMNTQDE